MDSLAAINLVKAYNLDTSRSELLSEAAFSYNRIKNYNKSIEIYKQKIWLKKANANDYLSMGKAYFIIEDYANADTILAIFNVMQPDYVQGWMLRARTKDFRDSADNNKCKIEWLASHFYETIMEKTQSDTIKYNKERLEALYYLAHYHLCQFYKNPKLKEEGEKAVDYYTRMIMANPNDENSILIKKNQVIEKIKQKLK
jgi:hypothetical protein